MDQDPKKNTFNLKDILLPKKEERTSASASRVNAGVLLDGEQKAELPKTPAPAPIAPPVAPQGPVETTDVASLQTYQSDVNSVISQQNISVVSIAAAEAKRAERALESVTPVAGKTEWGWIKKLGVVVASITLVVVATGLLLYVFLRPRPSITVGQGISAPFIAVDDTEALVIKPEQLNRDILLQNLNSMKEKTALSLGLMSRSYIVVSSTTLKESEVPQQMSVQSLLGIIAPNTTDEFLRTLDPIYYVLGTHVFDGNQAFIILRVDSYERAFSGMLEWERTMEQELSPLFTRTPRPKIGSELTASTTIPAALIKTSFRDTIVANHDARVVLNEAGDILLLWTFLDRNTLVITTNESTLFEIISRRSTFNPTN
ncbi:MAG: hypothetical protein V4436_00475 [Patescibacteria group bacterium]